MAFYNETWNTVAGGEVGGKWVRKNKVTLSQNWDQFTKYTPPWKRWESKIHLWCVHEDIPSEWSSSWHVVEIQTAKGAMGTSSIVGFYSTSANYTTFWDPKFDAPFSAPDYVAKLESGDPAALCFHLGWQCFLWRKQAGASILPFYFTGLEAVTFLRPFS